MVRADPGTLSKIIRSLTKTQIQAALKTLAALKNAPKHTLSADNYGRLDEMLLNAMCPPAERTGSAEVFWGPVDYIRIDVAVRLTPSP